MGGRDYVHVRFREVSGLERCHEDSQSNSQFIISFFYRLFQLPNC